MFHVHVNNGHIKHKSCSIVIQKFSDYHSTPVESQWKCWRTKFFAPYLFVHSHDDILWTEFKNLIRHNLLTHAMLNGNLWTGPSVVVLILAHMKFTSKLLFRLIIYRKVRFIIRGIKPVKRYYFIIKNANKS